MASKTSLSTGMRLVHRYLGFFLIGIMIVYSVSGIIMIFRNTDFLKQEKHMSKTIAPNANEKELGEALKIRQLKVLKTEGDIVYFENGTYEKSTGRAEYTVKELPKVLNNMTQIHKARSGDSLYYLNIFFGVSLFFFSISSLWMFAPKSSIFKKGMYFTIAGIVLTLLLLFI